MGNWKKGSRESVGHANPGDAYKALVLEATEGLARGEETALLAGETRLEDYFDEYARYYHYTPCENLPAIRRHGLLPPAVTFREVSGVSLIRAEEVDDDPSLDAFMRENYGRCRIQATIPPALVRGHPDDHRYFVTPHVPPRWLDL